MTSGTSGSSRWYRMGGWTGTDAKKRERPRQVHSYYAWKQERVNPNYEYSRPWIMTELNYSPYPDLGNFRRNLLNNEIVSYLADLVQELEFANDIIEARSTAQLLPQYLKGILKATRKLKKLPRELLKFKGKKQGEMWTGVKPWKQIRKDVRKRKRDRDKPKKSKIEDSSWILGEWLKYNFAVRPFLGTLADFTNIFDQPFEVSYFRKTFNMGEYLIYDFQGTKRVHTCKVRIGGGYRVKNPNVGVATSLGVTDLAKIAWEVFPWSWAIDYFTSFGDWLSNLDGRFNNVEWSREYRTSLWRCNGQTPGTNENRKPNLEFGWGQIINRETSLPKQYKLMINFDAEFRQCTYLMSAITQTLKSKMS